MLDAVRYAVDNGVKWANLPADFPPYRRVHAFAPRWQVTGLLAEFHDLLRDRVREKEGRMGDPTAAIVDSQSVRAAATPYRDSPRQPYSTETLAIQGACRPSTAHRPVQEPPSHCRPHHRG
ncbi:transposase [Streptomyces sp. NPDC055722]